jgi:hypothetical protein
MKAISINRWLTLGANLGVLVGIVFLAIELRQNNDLLEAQTRAENFDRIIGFAEQIIENPALATALQKTENNEEITEVEDILLRAMALRAFRQLEWTFREVQAGRLEGPVPVELYRKGFRSEGIFRWPLGEYWGVMKGFFSPDFVLFVEENIVHPNAD